MTLTLSELAKKYSSDKFFRHSYMPAYDALLGWRNVHRLLEIGIGYQGLMEPFLPLGVPYHHGSSLHMWAEYWPQASIYACDIRPDALINEGRIQSWVADQSKPFDLERLVANCGGKLDVIIDDGSHQLEHQQITARTLLPWLQKGGVYVIEDTYPDKGEELVKEFGGRLYIGSKTPDDCFVVIAR